MSSAEGSFRSQSKLRPLPPRRRRDDAANVIAHDETIMARTWPLDGEVIKMSRPQSTPFEAEDLPGIARDPFPLFGVHSKPDEDATNGMKTKNCADLTFKKDVVQDIEIPVIPQQDQHVDVLPEKIQKAQILHNEVVSARKVAKGGKKVAVRIGVAHDSSSLPGHVPQQDPLRPSEPFEVRSSSPQTLKDKQGSDPVSGGVARRKLGNLLPLPKRRASVLKEKQLQSSLDAKQASMSLAQTGNSLSVCVGTWNMGGKRWDTSMTLQDWLPRDTYDVYAVGVQECETSAGVSVATARPAWEASLQQHFGNEYRLIARRCLGTTHLSCFIRQRLYPECSDVHHAHVITGFAKLVPNKAGIGICFDFRHTSFLFVTAHFAAHVNKVQARNDNFRRIDTNLLRLMCPVIATQIARVRRQSSASNSIGFNFLTTRVSASSTPVSPTGVEASNADAAQDNDSDDEDAEAAANTDMPAPLTSAGAVAPEAASVAPESASAHFDRVFWFGDFNYRIDKSRKLVDSALESSGTTAKLLEEDQLNQQKAKKAVFEGFAEGDIAFRPTYKFDKGSDTYDTKKQRVPAWTDRILYRTRDGQQGADYIRHVVDTIKVKEYTSIESIKTSDHRPVVGFFEVSLNCLDPTAKKPKRDAKNHGSGACSIL